jgi:hypothetical protein
VTRGIRRLTPTGRLGWTMLLLSLMTATAIAVALAAGTPAAMGGKGKRFAFDSWGGAQARWPGVRAVVLETDDGHKNRPVAIDRWGLELVAYVKDAEGLAHDVPAFTCNDGTGSSASVPKELPQQHISMISNTATLPFMRDVRVRKGRFSQHEAYDIQLQSGVIHQEHTFRGRFRRSNRVSGTIEVNQVVQLYDGTVRTCRSGPIAWSACRGDLDPVARFKPCLGIEQEAWFSPTGQAEPLSVQGG